MASICCCPPLSQDREMAEHHVQIALDGGAVGAREGTHFEVLHHGHIGKDAPPLGNVGDAHGVDTLRLHPVDAGVLEPDFAVRGPHEPGDRAQRRGFAGAVCADQRHDLALGHAERDVADRRNLFVQHRGVLDAKQQNPRLPDRPRSLSGLH
jgi:hypothetical protein